jgi:NADPH2:quinone reductase
METAILAGGAEVERYGSGRHKQVYIYGSLDNGPTEILRNFGMAWSVAAWLLMPFLSRIGPTRSQALREQVVAGLKTIFAIHYTKEIGLRDLLQPEAIAAVNRRATGQKHLIRPWA